ncbi:MAG TPA: hypothetical protein VES19_13860 [Candidatus Limnocylindrales bacterium]|nr:hypothetical protein [Candidatus Limnocylindrales bacterium]
MPMPVVSPTLFNVRALPADPADTHLRQGIHVRVAAHPQLGLPVAPFVVWRGMSKDGAGLQLRTEAVFVDSRGSLLAAPFQLTPENPVTAYLVLAPGEVCIWAQVYADPFSGGSGGGRPPRGGRPPIDRGPLGPQGPLGTPGSPGTPAPGPVRTTRDILGGARLAGSRSATDLVAAARVKSGMLVTAFVSTSQGPAAIGSRHDPPYSFSGPGIVQLLLEGQGSVSGVTWLEQRAIPKLDWEPWTVLNLPHKGGPRYLSVDGALLRAAARVLDQAPRRTPLQETIGAVPPAAAPPAGPVDEAKRVDSLARPLAPSLDRLVSDLSAPALELIESDPVVDERGTSIGTITQRCIDRVLQGQLDPGSAALMGYKALDDEFGDPQPLLVFYWVTGFFRNFPPSALAPSTDPIFDIQLALLPDANRVGDEKRLLTAFETEISGLPVKVDQDTVSELERTDDYIGLGALAVADRNAPADPMLPPLIDGTTHVGWLPVVPPDARREVRVDISGVATAGLLAAEKQTPDGGALRESLNRANDDGYHLPLALSLDTDDDSLDPVPEPGTGFLADRRATAAAIGYYVAQQDSFGRWSEWAPASNLPGVRPRPPRPVFRAFYTQPADPAASGGTIRVMADVPQLENLAPGSFPLTQLEVTATDLATNVVTLHPQTVGDPLDPDDALDFDWTGPLLAPTERRKVRLVAAWRDTDGTASVDSEPVVLTLNDPRPPAQISVPDALQYSGRPDVLGLSMVEHAWTAVPGQAGFAVYYTDENRLVAYLAGAAAGSAGAAVRDALAATTDPAARATLLRSNPALFPSHLFERLAGVTTHDGSGGWSFRHAVSGSLRVLNLYRVSAESETSARVDLSTLALLVFAVPNADPPARPVLEVVPDDMTANSGEYAACVTVTLTPGVTEAATWRLRRSSLGATDVLRMPVVTANLPMGELEADGRQRATLRDHGPVLISGEARLKPWVRYYWVAEAQGDPAPGSVAAGRPVPGAWSAPSDPVSLLLVPPRAPEPVESLAATGTPVGGPDRVGVVLAFGYPRIITGGEMGPYRLRIARRVPGGAFEVLSEAEFGGTEPPYEVSGMRPGDAADQVPAGALYRLVLVDPLGREGEPAEAVLP